MGEPKFMDRIKAVTPLRMHQRSLSRRRFLKETFLGLAVLSVAKVFPLSFLFGQRRPPGSAGLKYFSDNEYLVAQAVAERLIGPPQAGGPTAGDIDVAARADRFLASADPEIREQFHLLLTVFNSPLAAFIFSFHFSTFVTMSPQNQHTYLEGWMTSRLAFRRTGFQGLKRLAMSMFYTDSRTWKEFGYQAVTVPEDSR